MAQIVDTDSITDFVINKVPSQAIFEDMVANNQVNADELYLVEGDTYGNIVSYSVVEVTS